MKSSSSGFGGLPSGSSSSQRRNLPNELRTAFLSMCSSSAILAADHFEPHLKREVVLMLGAESGTVIPKAHVLHDCTIIREGQYFPASHATVRSTLSQTART